MRLTRRQVLGCAAAVALPRWRIDRPALPIRATPRFLVLDLERGCALRESVSGYERALGVSALHPAALPATSPAALIVPGAVELEPVVVDAIRDCLSASGCVILETGLASHNAGDCESHRTAFVDVLGIQTRAPVSLWSQAGARIPYIDFTWPRAAKIRDHSLVVPLEAQGDSVIASVDGLPVGLMGWRGRGRLIVLGSPIGQALWAGDVEAHGWLDAVLGVAREPSARPRT